MAHIGMDLFRFAIAFISFGVYEAWVFYDARAIYMLYPETIYTRETIASLALPMICGLLYFFFFVIGNFYRSAGDKGHWFCKKKRADDTCLLLALAFVPLFSSNIPNYAANVGKDNMAIPMIVFMVAAIVFNLLLAALISSANCTCSGQTTVTPKTEVKTDASKEEKK